MIRELKNSTRDQDLLRVAALWAAEYVEQALSVFESRYPDDTRPRAAVEAGRAYGQGEKRGKTLRTLSMAAFKIGKDVDEPSKYVAIAASRVAAIAYTHTDLQTGKQGVRQARHILDTVVYSALALELAGGTSDVVDSIIRSAIETAPQEVKIIIRNMPPQPIKGSRLGMLLVNLDTGLRTET